MSASSEARSTNWAKHMDPHTTITVKFRTKVDITNVSLGVSVREPLQRTSFLVRIHEKGPFFNVCSFLPGRVENHCCNLTLFPNKEYQFKASGGNPIDLMGIKSVVESTEDEYSEHSEEEQEEEGDESVKAKGKSCPSSPKKARSKPSKVEPAGQDQANDDNQEPRARAQGRGKAKKSVADQGDEETPTDEKVTRTRGRGKAKNSVANQGEEGSPEDEKVTKTRGRGKGKSAVLDKAAGS